MSSGMRSFLRLYLIDADSKGSQQAEQQQAGVGHVKDDKIMGEQPSHGVRLHLTLFIRTRPQIPL